MTRHRDTAFRSLLLAARDPSLLYLPSTRESPMSTPPPMSSATVAPLLQISPPNRPLAKAKPCLELRPCPQPKAPSMAGTTNDSLCVYRATACTNPRATKANGQRHKFCQFHLRQTSLAQQKQAKTPLFRDPSRVPAALLRQIPQTKLTSIATASSAASQVLPRLRSHDVLKRALLRDSPTLPTLAPIANQPLVRPLVPTQPLAQPTLRLPSIHTLVPKCLPRRDATPPSPTSPSHLSVHVPCRLSVSSSNTGSP
jgi:hypothetical protein